MLALGDHEGGDVAVYDSDVPQAEDESSITGLAVSAEASAGGLRADQALVAAAPEEPT